MKDTDYDQALGAAIRRHRIDPPTGYPRLSQQALGEKMTGQTRGKAAAVAISRIEAGALSVPESRLRLLAKELGTTADALREEAQQSLLAEARERALSEAASSGGVASLARRAMGGRMAQENFKRRIALEAEVAERQRTTELNLERLADAQRELIDDVLSPFISLAERVNRPLPPRPETRAHNEDLSREGRLAAYREDLSWQIANTVGATTIGAGAGLAVGGSAAAAIFTWVAAAATASTGAAISGLSGAAATSATLAWLGGGPLAAGGLGVAGGTLVLGSIVTLPALIAAGGVFAVQARKKRREASAEADRLTQAEEQLAGTLPVLQRVWRWTMRERRILEEFTTIASREVRWLSRELGERDEPVAWSAADPKIRDRFEELMDLVVRSMTVLSLPILRDLDPDADSDDDVQERQDWIEVVLCDAEAFMEGDHPQFTSTAGP